MFSGTYLFIYLFFIVRFKKGRSGFDMQLLAAAMKDNLTTSLYCFEIHIGIQEKKKKSNTK